MKKLPVTFLLALSLLFVAVDFFLGNKIPFDPWMMMQYFPSSQTIDQDHEFIHSHLATLVRGDDRITLDSTGFACDMAVHSVVCVSIKCVRVDMSNMNVYIPFSHDHQEKLIRPYARQEDQLKQISPVHMLLQHANTTPPPPCQYHHNIPAVIFSSGNTGNVFHEMNEIIIPLFISTKQFQSRVLFILEDYNPSFIAKYGKVLSGLSAYEVMNPATNRSVHCFPGSVVGLKYHDNLALNSSDIPGGYAMPDFRHFLWQAYSLRFVHVSQITTKPRLLLLSRTNTRRFLNEDEMIALMERIGFQVIVIRRSKVISNLNKFSQLINSCSVLVGAHGAGLTNEIFLPSGAVMVQVELLGMEWASNTYYGDTARAMGVRYLRYKIEAEESSLYKLYGRNHSVVTDPGSVYRNAGLRAARTVFLDQQNVRIDLVRFRETIVEALSMVTDWGR